MLRRLSPFFASWFVFTLPVISALCVSDYSRFTLYQTCVHWRGKVAPVPYVFVGDSIAASGRNWSILTWQPFAVRNLATPFQTIRQIQEQAKAVKLIKAKRVIVLAGTNDVLEGRTLEQIAADYAQLLDLLNDKPVIVTLVPHLAQPEKKQAVDAVNNAIKELCQARNIPTINMNPIIAPDGVLLAEYSKDGIHLNEYSIQVWANEISKAAR